MQLTKEHTRCTANGVPKKQDKLPQEEYEVQSVVADWA